MQQHRKWMIFMAKSYLRCVYLAATPLLALGACGDAGLSASAKQKRMATSQAETPSKTVENNDISSKEVPLSTTDVLMLEAAEKACQAEGGGNPSQFLDAFARSAAVRRKYLAPSIKYRIFAEGGPIAEQIVTADHYDRFPIKIVDYYRRPVRPSPTGQDDEYVEVEFNRSQSNHLSVDWTIVRYVGQSDGGDDLGQPVDLKGNPYDPVGRKSGQLLFNHKGDCWQLVADHRFGD
jgi:hypothetical protein